MKFLAIIEDTFREGIARKTILTFFVISTLFIVAGLLVAIFANTENILSFGQTNFTSQEKAVASAGIVKIIQAMLAGLVNAGVIFLGLFATASIIPNTLEKGNIDLLLSKPISRTELLLGKMTGSILIVLVNVMYFVLAMWLIISIKTGYWNWMFLVSPFLIAFAFFVLYSLMMFIGVATRSTALSLLVVYTHLLILTPILAARDDIARWTDKPFVGDLLNGIYYILPKTGDIGQFSAGVIVGKSVDWMPVWSSGLFAVVMVALSIYLFRKKEY